MLGSDSCTDPSLLCVMVIQPGLKDTMILYLWSDYRVSVL